MVIRAWSILRQCTWHHDQPKLNLPHLQCVRTHLPQPVRMLE